MRTLFILFISSLLLACAPTTVAPNPQAAPPAFPVSQPSGNQSSVGKLCGGYTRAPAPTCSGENEYCHRDIRDICGAADAPGTCRVKPEMCTMDYGPVCGCDGKTYPNECAANSNGVSAASHGECR